jgi:hypothetical protein
MLQTIFPDTIKGGQLYRKVGMHDVRIMNTIHMIGEGAYTRYTEMFNEAAPAPVPVPTFSNVHAAVEWAAAHARTGIDETLKWRRR